jgi:hypothetical protein
MKNVDVFFNELRLNAGSIWIENDSIVFSAPKKFQNEETRDFITSNKNLIVSTLAENGVLSKEKSLSTVILRNSAKIHYPLSPAQERLWFIEQYEEGTNAFHIPDVYELDATTDKEGIQYALRQIVSRHEILRSTIGQRADLEHGIQIVHDEPLLIEEVSLSDKDDWETIIRSDINRPFDLSREYPIRVKFYTIEHAPDNTLGNAPDNASDKTLVLINKHHIASDGWSNNVFELELFAYYKAFVNQDRAFSLPPLEIQYKDYALWQRSWLTGENLQRQLSYWKNKLSGHQTLQLPTDYPRPGKIDYKGAFLRFSIDKNISQQLRGLAQRYGVTLNSVMLSGFTILLSKYTGQQDIVTGSPSANRHRRADRIFYQYPGQQDDP